MDDRTPRVSPKSLEGLVSDTLKLVFEALDGAKDTPHARELRAKARSYERIVAAWATVPPSGPQREAAFDLVVELHGKVRALKGHDGSSGR